MEKITHLIPLSEFVNHVKQLEKPIDQPFEAFKLFQLGLIFRYTTFLEQPLELWQFVAVGDNGEVLEEPKNDDECSSFFEKQEYFGLMKKYEQAKERCLFEGYIWDKENETAYGEVLFADIIDVHFFDSFSVIRDLYMSIPLTQSALKQIY